MSIFNIGVVCVGNPCVDEGLVPIGWVVKRLSIGDSDAAMLHRWPKLTSTDLVAVRAFVRAKFEKHAVIGLPSVSDEPDAKPDDDDGNYIK